MERKSLNFYVPYPSTDFKATSREKGGASCKPIEGKRKCTESKEKKHYMEKKSID